MRYVLNKEGAGSLESRTRKDVQRTYATEEPRHGSCGPFNIGSRYLFIFIDKISKLHLNVKTEQLH